MKRNLSAALIALLFTATALSQAPESINYQAAVYDNDGNAIGNQSVNVRFAILEGGASGPITYEEEHTDILTTNQGLFNIRIGEGTNTGMGSAPDFSSINWGAANYFLRVEADAGQGYEILGVTQFVSVPYALYAKEAGSAGGGDADADPSNELNESATLTGTELSITDAGGDVTVDLAPLQDGVDDADADPSNELQDWSSLPGIPSDFTDGTDDVDDLDNDPTNELQDWTTLTGIPDDFTDGIDNVVDGDASATNEIQSLSLSGATLTLSDGGGSVVLPADNDWTESGSNVYKTTGNVGIGTSTPTTALDVNGGIRMQDGTEGSGKVMVSDASGLASWQNSGWSQQGSLNTSSISASTTWQPIGPSLSFAKLHTNSSLEITANTRVYSGTFSGGALGVLFDIKVDGSSGNYFSQGAITSSGVTEFLSFMAVFNDLPAGTYTIQIYTRTYSGGSTGVLLDPGGWGGKFLVKESF